MLLRQNFPAASNILRYEILFKQGGYYFDCDILPRINPEIIPYIEKATEHLIPKNVKTPLFFAKLIAQDLSESLDEKYNRNVYENIITAIWHLNKDLWNKTDFKFEKKFETLKAIFS